MSDFYPVWVGTQRFMIATDSVSSIERIRNVGSTTTALHTRWGRTPLCHVHTWINTNEPRQELPYHFALVVATRTGWVGVVVDRIDDVIRHPTAIMPLPNIVYDSLFDPTIVGVLMLDDVPCLVLDLEAFVLIHLPAEQAAGLFA